MSDKMRITGMASGIDVDSAVKQMMKAHNVRLDKVKQDRQLIKWQQDLYRDIIGDLTSFRSNYFDVLKPDANMLSSSNYAGFSVTCTDGGTPQATVAGVTATANADALAGNYTLKVSQLAKSAVLNGTSINSNSISIDPDVATNWAGKDISISVDGQVKTITLSDSTIVKDLNSLASDINSKITSPSSGLSGKLSAIIVDGKLQFNNLSNNTIKIASAGTTVTDANLAPIADRAMNPTNYVKLTDLNSAASGMLSLSLKYNGSAPVSVNIDNTDGTKTVSDVISEISRATGGNVVASFSQLTGQFTLKTAATGSNTSVSVEASSSPSLLTALGVSTGTGTSGQDAILSIKTPAGVEKTITKTSNSFSLDGLNYNLTKGPDVAASPIVTNISVTSNTKDVFDKIKTFIDKYNEIVDKLNKKVSEKKQYDYKPLTDDQKKDMKEEDIKAWEDRAKEGLLKNDLMLDNIVNSMRRAFFEGVEGAGISLKELGLNTSSDISQRGKIIFDQTLGGEQRLKDAIANRGQQVANLFMKVSTKQPSYNPDLNESQRRDRNSDEGIFQRINDILQDYVRTTRNSSNKKGLLIEKAGIKGDFTEFNNMIYDQIKYKDKTISDLTRKIAEKEEKYYQQFSRLEQAMNSMNSQSAWLTQQLGGGAK